MWSALLYVPLCPVYLGTQAAMSPPDSHKLDVSTSFSVRAVSNAALHFDL